jgi:hypothetical protein
MLDAADRRRRQAARSARDRRYRARLKSNKAVCSVEYDGYALDWLIRCHALDPAALEIADMDEMRRIIGDAISRLIAVSSRV